MNLNPTFSIKNEYLVETTTFCEDVIMGLSAKRKYLDSKYFYDTKGDALFQKIMNSPEYYLSRCELEILKHQAHPIAMKLMNDFKRFDLIELGPGDASKSIHLLQALQRELADFRYIPVDISKNVITHLEEKIPVQVKGCKIRGMAGEYLDMLTEINYESNLPKVILFLGSSIGNLYEQEALVFFRAIHSLLNIDDLLLIGFDLKKDPNLTLAAYNDKGGITKAFNLNLLERINRELGANFNLEAFAHFPTYNPESSLCKSFLISKKEQTVLIKQTETEIVFKKNEAIFMEKSMKYSLKKTEKLAQKANFSVENHFFDSKNWFVDSLWKRSSTL